MSGKAQAVEASGFRNLALTTMTTITRAPSLVRKRLDPLKKDSVGQVKSILTALTRAALSRLRTRKKKRKRKTLLAVTPTGVWLGKSSSPS
jgi:hypothetical protein